MNTRELQFPSNRVRDIERHFQRTLAGQYPEGEVRMMVRMLFEEYLGWSHTELLLHREDTINQSDLLRFHWALEGLKAARPIQYIVGHTDFCGCRIEVNPSVLIPRPETEEIVLKTIEMTDGKPPRNIADLCTGSGCIAIALAKHWPQATVTAVELSREALQTARHNASENGVTIDFIQGNLLKEAPLPPRHYDLIISNPPYVREQERTQMQRNVVDYEPAAALYVPDAAPLMFYEAIGTIAEERLAPEGLLVLEINEQLANETTELLSRHGFESTVYEDFRGKPRMVAAQRAATTT